RVAPCRWIGEERAQQLLVERVAGTDAVEVADDRRAREIEIAERVQHFVPHELVDIAEAFAIEHFVAADHHRIVERSAPSQSGGAKLIDLVEEAEGASATDMRLEAVGIDGDGDVLPADGV